MVIVDKYSYSNLREKELKERLREYSGFYRDANGFCCIDTLCENEKINHLSKAFQDYRNHMYRITELINFFEKTKLEFGNPEHILKWMMLDFLALRNRLL